MFGGDIVLDFFAGSATTAHAVLAQNREDGGNRRFIMVQLPEPMDHPEYANIAEVGKERIRRVIKRMREEETRPDEDLGFRVFKLDKSPRRQWQDLPPDTSAEAYQRQLELFIAEPLVEGWAVADVIADVAVKEAGFGLSYRIEQIALSEQTIYKVIDDKREQHFYICLDNNISFEMVRQLGLALDDLFIFRDSAVDDSTAANLALTCRVKSL